jgi:D-3-phosphoglycerate dehydrogenase
MNIAIPDDYQDCVRSLRCFSVLEGHDVHIFNDSITDLDAMVARYANAQAIVLTRERTSVSDELLARLPRLRLIAQTGRVGAHVDVAACTAHGVAVADSAGDGSVAAELTWALIMASRRHLVEEVNRLKAGLWQGFVGQQLRGQRLGIWSYGRIGEQVARYGKAFGMDVWVWGGEASTARAVRDGFQRAPSREAFFVESDVLSLHLRLTPATEGIVTAADLARMKATALFVNTSRAQLVEFLALEEALARGRPGYGAVDVFEKEPVRDGEHPLVKLPNALCTPHIGFVERDNYENYYGAAFDHIVRYASGQAIDLVNPHVLQHERQQIPVVR